MLLPVTIASDHVNADMPASPSSRLVAWPPSPWQPYEANAPPSITSSRVWNFRCSRGKRIMLRGLEMLGTYVLGQSELKCRRKKKWRFAKSWFWFAEWACGCVQCNAPYVSVTARTPNDGSGTAKTKISPSQTSSYGYRCRGKLPCNAVHGNRMREKP